MRKPEYEMCNNLYATASKLIRYNDEIPVSYTHLDVYKRQDRVSIGLLETACQIIAFAHIIVNKLL